jgi:hypothetical protein
MKREKVNFVARFMDIVDLAKSCALSVALALINRLIRLLKAGVFATAIGISACSNEDEISEDRGGQGNHTPYQPINVDSLCAAVYPETGFSYNDLSEMVGSFSLGGKEEMCEGIMLWDEVVGNLPQYNDVEQCSQNHFYEFLSKLHKGEVSEIEEYDKLIAEMAYIRKRTLCIQDSRNSGLKDSEVAEVCNSDRKKYGMEFFKQYYGISQGGEGPLKVLPQEIIDYYNTNY